jgi:hypothetical protein
MSEMRYFKTQFWTDSYIENLSSDMKLLYTYFITSPQSNLSGVYEISIKRISTDTGINIDKVREALLKFENDNKIFYKSGFVIMKNHLKNQRMNANMWAGASSIFSSLPEEVKKFCIMLKSFDQLNKSRKDDRSDQSEVIDQPEASLIDPQMKTITFEEFKDEMNSSDTWIIDLSRHFSLSDESIRDHLNKFIEERRINKDWNFKENTSGKMIPKTLKMNKDHFFNTLSKMNTKKK